MSTKNAISIEDLRALAKKRLPKMVFDYIDGGADDELTLARNISRFRDRSLVWRALTDISVLDTQTKIMGCNSALPFFISPTASSRLFNPKGGEIAVAKAAEKYGIPYSISTIGSTSIEDVAAASNNHKFFQIYVWKDRGVVKEIIARVKAAGFAGIILTVDVPVAGNRERDPRNKFTIPPKPNLSVAMQMLARPGYLIDMATSGKIDAANFKHIKTDGGGIIEFINSQFDRTVTWKDAEWMRQEWGGKFAIKGIATAKDAQNCLDVGADAVWISNHGGRQLDTSPATIDTLPAIAEQVAGRAEIILDGGIRRGTDIMKALAMGATSVAIGRAYLYGLGAAGQIGVERALAILKDELLRDMALCGAKNIGEITRELVV
jgi:L-lactate dehydrogenase (cytochrome)